MKKIIPLTFGLMLATTAHSADWTPAFDYLKAPNVGDNGKMINDVMSNIFVDNIHSKNYKKINVLTKSAQTGNYGIPTPYKNDLLPAKAYKNPDKDTVLRAVIPLKNATLYGLPISEFIYEYYCFECGGVGFSVKFAPMTNAQYQYLQKSLQFQNTEITCDEEQSASFSKYKSNVYLNLHIGC